MAVLQGYGTLVASRGKPLPARWVFQGHPSFNAGILLLLVATLPLAARYRFPRTVLVCVMLPTIGYFGLGYPDGPGFFACLVAVFGAVRAGHRVFTWITVGLGYLGYAWLAVAESAAGPGKVITVGLWSAVAVGFAEATRVRTAHIAEMAQARMERQRAYAERQRASEEHERRQASEERLRIAQELHDVIGHHLSLINVQAGVGLHLMDEQPEQARTALVAVKHASSEALREIRAVLASLNQDRSAPRGPAPGLAALDQLVADVTAAGLAVKVEVVGEQRPVAGEVDRAAYQIIREAMTNVRRHAGPAARAVIRVEYRPEQLIVAVTDDGAGAAAVPSAERSGPAGSAGSASAASEVAGSASGRGAGSAGSAGSAAGGIAGSGVSGMVARAEAVGGVVVAGPRDPRRPTEGFEVRATLPLGRASEVQ